jgi:hypothetical protein
MAGCKYFIGEQEFTEKEFKKHLQSELDNYVKNKLVDLTKIKTITNEKANEVRKIENGQGKPENEGGQPQGGSERPQTNVQEEKDKVVGSGVGDVETKQQIENFGVNKEDVEPVHSVISQVFNGLKNAGLTAAKTVGDWVGISKGGVEKPYSLKINGKDVQVKNVQPEVVNGFYSPLEKVITDSKFDKLPAKQWAEKYANSEEAKWTGLKDWLAQQQGSVSKADIQQYLKDNRIQVVEVAKGGEGNIIDYDTSPKEVQVLFDKMESGKIRQEQFIEKMRDKGYTVEVGMDGEIESVTKGDVQPTKFQGYQTEGEKSNYKEVLVTLPTEKSKIASRRADLAKIDRERPLTESEQKEYDSLQGEGEAEYKSSHFDEPNILVHLRMNTRVDSEGNKVLFLEEVQSDWGQKGKKEGFKGEELDPANLTFKVTSDGTFNLYQLYDKSGNLVFELPASKSKGDNVFTKESLRQEFKGSQAIELMGKNTPTAPFVTDTNAWTKLGLKVALKEAVKQGVDKIAWTTGEQQNERYDLSKQVDRIEYNSHDGSLEGYKDRKPIFKEKGIKENQLADYIGKDAAEKLINEGKMWDNQVGGSSYKLEGDQLKVGGKGMKGFYGSPTEGSLGIVGNVAKSLFKQEPKTVTLTDNATEYQVFLGGQKEETFKTKKEAQDYVDEIKSSAPQAPIEIKEAKIKGNERYNTTQHSIDITPELKASAEQGQPLFKDAEAQYRIESSKNIVEAIKDFNGSPRATVALTHEIMHPTVVAIIDGAKESNEVGTKHTETIISEFNKANPKSQVTVEDLIKGNDAFKDGTTSKQYRAVQEFIAKSWEKYHKEGGKGFSAEFQKVLEQITKAFQSVYKSLTGKQLTPELRKMFDEILGKEQSTTQEEKVAQGEAIPPNAEQLLTTKKEENAINQKPIEESVSAERENGNKSQETNKTSVGDKLLGAEKSEEEIAKQKDAKKMSFASYKNKYKDATMEEYQSNRTANTSAASAKLRDLSQSIKDDKTTKASFIPPHLIAKGLDLLADAIDAGVNIKNAIADIVAKLTKEHEGVNGIELEKELLDKYNEQRNKDLTPKQLVVNGHNIEDVLKENPKYVEDLKEKLSKHYEQTNPELFNDKDKLNEKLDEGVQKLKDKLVAERNRVLNGGRNYLAEGKPEDAYKLFKANGMNDFEAEEALGKIKDDALTEKQKIDATKSVMKNLLDRLDEFIGERRVSKTIADSKVDEIQKDIKGALEKGQKLQDVDMAMHVYLDLQRNPDHLAEYLPKIEKGAKEGLAKFKEAKKIIDLSQNLTDKQKEVAQKIADTYKAIGEQAKGVGVINEVLDNYVGRTWDIGGKPASEQNFKFATSTRHSIERSLDTIIQGLANGMDLKYKGASTNLGVIMEEIGNVIANRNFIEEGLKKDIDTGMKDADGNPIQTKLFTTNSDQKGYKQIDNKNFRGYEGSKKVPIYAPEEIANSLNNILGTSTFKEGSIMKKIETYNAALKVLELSLSPFHAFQFGRRHFFGATHNGFGDMNPIKAYKQGLEMIQKDPQFVLDLVKYGNVNLGITPEWSEMVIDHSTYLGKQMDKLAFTKAAKDGVLNFNKDMHNWLFNKFGTGLTLHDAKTEYERLSKVHPEMSNEEKMKVVGKFISNLYGNKNWDVEHGSAMQNKKNQSLLRQLFLAPNWTLSNLSLAKNAFNKGVEGELYRRMWAKTILKGLALSLTANAGLALMNENDEDAKKSFAEKFVGRYKRAYKNGFIHTLDVDISPLYHLFGGNPKKTAYLSTLGAFDEPLKAGEAVSKGIIGVGNDKTDSWKGNAALNYVSSKLSPIARMTSEAVLDKDWMDKQFKSIDEVVDDYKQGGKNKFTLTKREGKDDRHFIVRPSQLPTYALHQVMGLVPIGLSTGIQMMEGQKDGVEALMNLSGIGVKTMKDKASEQKSTSDMTPEELQQYIYGKK